MRLSTILGWLVVASILASILLGVAGSAWRYTYGLTAATQFTLWMFLFGLLAIPCAMCFERGRRRALMASGMAAAGLSVLFCAAPTLFVQWYRSADTWLAVCVATPVFVWTGWCTIAAILLVRRTTSPLAILLRRATMILAAMLSLAVVGYVWFERVLHRHDEEIVRVIGGLSLLTFFGLASSFLAVRLRYTEPDHVADAEEEIVRRDFTVTCPRCGVRQGTRTGGAACTKCGLGIKVLVP